MENNLNIESKVMEEIKSGRVKLRSKYIFLAEKLGVGSAFALSIILAILFFTLLLFYLRSSDNLFYLSFGSRGFMAFLDSFPYSLVLVSIFCLLVAGFILKKTNLIYKRPFGQMAIFLIIAVILLSTVLTFTRLAERIEQGTFNPNSPGRFFRPFLSRCFEERRGGVVGRTVEVGGDYIIIQTPNGLRQLQLDALEQTSLNEMATGSWVMAVGEGGEGSFSVKLIKRIDVEEMPFVERGVRRHFGQQFLNTSTEFRIPCNMGGCSNK